MALEQYLYYSNSFIYLNQYFYCYNYHHLHHCWIYLLLSILTTSGSY